MEDHKKSDMVSSTMAASFKKKKKDKNEKNLISGSNSELKHKKSKKRKHNYEERRSNVSDAFTEMKQNGPKKKKRKGNETESSVTISEMKPKRSKKKKQIDEECLGSVTDFTEIKQNGSKKKKLKKKKNESNVTNSKIKGNAKKKKQNDEGSQSSLIDFVSGNKQNESKKKKRRDKEKKSTVKNSGTEEKQLKKRKQKDEEFLSGVSNNFTKIKQNVPKRKEKERKSTVTNSGMKQTSCEKKTQNDDESESSATNSEMEQNCPKKKRGKGEECQTIVTDCVTEQNAFKKKKGIEKASTSISTNLEIEQNGPQKIRRKGEESRSTVTNSESEHNYSKKKEGKVNKGSSSSATNLKKDQRSPKKRKANSEVKPGGSKKRKKDGSFLQSSEERGKMEDAFLIQHPHLASYIKGQLYCEGLESSSFTAMSAMLKECILREKWEDANRILCTMCMYQTPNVDCLWKFGAHVLQNHPSGNAELVEDLYRFVRKINMINPYQKKLEHALFLLRENRMKDALTTLTEMWSVGGRNGQQGSQQEIRKKMTSVYAGLIEYCQWHEETKKRLEEEVIVSKEADKLRKRALANLGKVNDDPGVWDIFITKQVEMLEAGDSISKADNILTNYLSYHQGNPNAHVYLYQFLKKYRPTKKDRLKQVLKKLATILPAEDYTLEYVELLEETGSAELKEVLPMLFSMADYSTCHGNSALWETLVDHVISIVESKDRPSKAILNECWSCRKSWWSSFHFDKHEASELVKKNPEAALQKAILASIFFGSSFPFVQKIQSAIRKRKPKLSKKLEEEISLWCNPAL